MGVQGGCLENAPGLGAGDRAHLLALQGASCEGVGVRGDRRFGAALMVNFETELARNVFFLN